MNPQHNKNTNIEFNATKLDLLMFMVLIRTEAIIS